VTGDAAGRARRLLLGSAAALLVFAPLAYGAVHTWAFAVVGLVVAALSLGLLTAAAAHLLSAPRHLAFLPRPPVWWLAPGLLLVLALQLAPWPQGLVRLVAPRAVTLRSLGEGWGLADTLPLSLNPHYTLTEALKFWPALVLFFLLVYAVRTRREILALVTLLLAVAFFQVLYGFWNFRSHLIWGWKNIHTGNRLCGTFINSNHLAGLLSMAILLGFGLFLGQGAAPPPGQPGDTWRTRLRRWSRSEHLEPQVRRGLLLLFLVVLATGLFFTGSRGGIMALLVGFGLMALLIWGRRRRRSHIWLIVIFLALSLTYSLLLGSAPALGRFLDLEQEGRYHALRGAWAIFTSFPLLGAGLGAYGHLYYLYEPARLKGVMFLYTHSDWAQLLAETGLAGFLLAGGAWVVFMAALMRQWQTRQDRWARGLGLGGLAALGAGVFHGLVDFPFHIPGFSLYFAAVAAVTYLVLYSHDRDGAFFSYPALAAPGRKGPGLVLLAGLGVIQLAFAGQLCYHWRAERAAPTEFNTTRPTPRSGVEDLQRSLALNPRNSAAWRGLAAALEVKARAGAASLEEAERALRQAVFYAPAYYALHALLAEFHLRHYQGDPARHLPAALKELEAAVTLFPLNGYLHWRLGVVLAWVEQYYVGFVPTKLLGQAGRYLERAEELEPRLKRTAGPSPMRP